MISVTEAKKIISENISSLEPVTSTLQNSAGLVLEEDVYASMDIPAFPQSSMDGYAISFNGWKQNKKLKNNSRASLTKNLVIRKLTYISLKLSFGY